MSDHPSPRPHHESRPLSRFFPKILMEGGEDIIQLVVSLTLIGIAGAVLFESIKEIFTVHPLFPGALLTSLNNVLFVVIILEILRTITAHFGDGGFQVGPFLVIGIIANVRHILTISASLSSEAAGSNTEFRRAMVELAINGGLILVMVVGLTLLHRIGDRTIEQTNGPKSH